MHKLLTSALLASLALGASYAQDAAPSEAVKTAQTLTDAYVAAFNKADFKALAPLYPEDAQFTSDAGEPSPGVLPWWQD